MAEDSLAAEKVHQGVIPYMVRKTTHARSAGSPAAVEEAVRKARSEKGVGLILVVYDKKAAHLYVEKERGRKRSAATDARTAGAR